MSRSRIAILALVATPLVGCSLGQPTLTYPAPCYGTVESALAAGDQEDATCATWTTPSGSTVTGPMWAMEHGDTRVRP